MVLIYLFQKNQNKRKSHINNDMGYFFVHRPLDERHTLSGRLLFLRQILNQNRSILYQYKGILYLALLLKLLLKVLSLMLLLVQIILQKIYSLIISIHSVYLQNLLRDMVKILLLVYTQYSLNQKTERKSKRY